MYNVSVAQTEMAFEMDNFIIKNHCQCNVS